MILDITHANYLSA